MNLFKYFQIYKSLKDFSKNYQIQGYFSLKIFLFKDIQRYSSHPASMKESNRKVYSKLK